MDVARLSPQSASRLISLTRVLIELPPQVLRCAFVVVVVSLGSEELELALRAGRQDRDLVHTLQDHEAALYYAHWITFCPCHRSTGDRSPMGVNLIHWRGRVTCVSKLFKCPGAYVGFECQTSWDWCSASSTGSHAVHRFAQNRSVVSCPFKHEQLTIWLVTRWADIRECNACPRWFAHNAEIITASRSSYKW